MGATSDPSGSQSYQYPVYVGVWTNWSRGRILGATLTLNRRDADLLIAFTAFFISFLASRTWRIICFIFHRCYSTANSQDATYHQRQAILRNSSSPESGIYMLSKLLWTNRRSNKWFRPLPAVLGAIFCLAAFTVAGGFSSQISTAIGNEVLIESSNCGASARATSFAQPETLETFGSYQATILSNAANYAQQCYSQNNSGLLDCGRFVTNRIPNEIDMKANCPFRKDVCKSQSENLRIDSGYIDSHKHLGLNAPVSQRFLYRNVLHCAPLSTAGFTSQRNLSVGPATLYHYGSVYSSGRVDDYVYAAKPVETQYSEAKSDDFTVGNQYFLLSTFPVTIKNEEIVPASSNFEPIDAITKTDADTFLVFLVGNGVVFSEFSQDLWYRSNTTPITVEFVSAGEVQTSHLYVPEEPASPLACTDQYQFCSLARRDTQECGPLASFRDAVAGAASLFDTTYDNVLDIINTTEKAASFTYFANLLYGQTGTTIVGAVDHLGPASLSSQMTLNSAVQTHIASNQWQIDVSHWWDIEMASQQAILLEASYVPAGSDLLSIRMNYTEPVLEKLCNNQKMRSTAYGSFSLFGLIFTYTLGIIVAIISFILEPISRYLHQKMSYKQYQHLEWTTNTVLQLQRLAHEEVGFGTWSEGTETIPVIKAGSILGSLDITNPNHPILRRPSNKTSITLLHAQDAYGTPETNSGKEPNKTAITPTTSDTNPSVDGEATLTPSDTSSTEEVPIPEMQRPALDLRAMLSVEAARSAAVDEIPVTPTGKRAGTI
ncbi:hypothetical protein F4679DRAFT_537883 [Xylaria curta]|nr:hypothetical protein F4679DRAFT_537883 [Xylaria curta]